jgi:hypothetical protein
MKEKIRRFKLVLRVETEVEIAQPVFDVVDDDWRRQLYDLRTPEEIASMIGRCLVMGWRLSSMDGWADQPDEYAQLDRRYFEVESCEEVLP